MRKIIFLSFLFIINCKTNIYTQSLNEDFAPSEVNDPNSFAQIHKAKITHLSWNVEADFNQKILKGSATYTIENNNSDEIVFDTYSLKIDSIHLENKEKAEFYLGEKDEINGSPLVIKINSNTKKLTIFYETSPDAAALQWLEPEQTHDKKHPFLLTQGQAILTRSYIPIQDTPSIRITYDANIRVPKDLLPLMSAVNPKEKNDSGIYHFEMNQPIPPYLIALAIGDVEYKSIDNRSGVYAESGLLEKAVWEFADVGKMIDLAENLYGPYLWEQYDVLVLPPSFPFGGMENPRLTFVTPTIIAEDRSLVTLIAHELAHSWSGNLVTNATWEDFWINEGFTVYFERRIMEELEGKDYVDMLSVIGFQDLEFSMNYIEPHFSSLKVNLKDRNPDDAFSDVPYDKGYLFLKMLEDRYGREKFDSFLKKYFSKHKFQTISTEQFIVYLKENLTQGEDDFVQEWIYDTGWPKNFEKPTSLRFQKVEERLEADLDLFKAIKLPKPEWSTHEWVHYIRAIPKTTPKETMNILNNMYSFTTSSNAEIAAAWFEKSIYTDYEEVKPQLKEFLIEVGRRKYLEPIYLALAETDNKDFAIEVYKEARKNYHSVSRSTVESILNYVP